jgi:hypothetical protein
VPPPDLVDAAILATGKTAEEIVQQLANALDVSIPVDQARDIDRWIDAVGQALKVNG